ncbi:MAG: hypothetical protein ABI336_09550 [Humibacillus sp.]
MTRRPWPRQLRRLTAPALVAALTLSASACSIEVRTDASPSATLTSAAPAGMERLRASNGLYAVPQLMSDEAPLDLPDTVFWLSARALTTPQGQVALSPTAASALRPVVNEKGGIDQLWMATTIRDRTGVDLVAPALVDGVLRLQRADGFFAPSDAPAADLAAADLVDYSFRAAEGLRGRRDGSWAARVRQAAKAVDPAALTTAYSRHQLSVLQGDATTKPAASTPGLVTATPPSGPADSEHVFDLLAQTETGLQLSGDLADSWVDWAAKAHPTAAEFYVVGRSLASGGAPSDTLARFHADVEQAAAAFARPDGTYHAYSETAGDLKTSYLYLVVSTLRTGSAWRDDRLVTAARAATAASSATPAPDGSPTGGGGDADPFETWDRYLGARVSELAGSGERVHSIELHPAWVDGLEQNVRSLPDNVLVAVDAGTAVPTLWRPDASTDPGVLAHLYVANWMARATAPSVSASLRAQWRSRLTAPPRGTSSRELYLTAAALLLADPQSPKDRVHAAVSSFGRPEGCGEVAFLTRTAPGSSECDLQAALAEALYQLVDRGETVEDALA